MDRCWPLEGINLPAQQKETENLTFRKYLKVTLSLYVFLTLPGLWAAWMCVGVCWTAEFQHSILSFFFFRFCLSWGDRCLSFYSRQQQHKFLSHIWLTFTSGTFAFCPCSVWGLQSPGYTGARLHPKPVGRTVWINIRVFSVPCTSHWQAWTFVVIKMAWNVRCQGTQLFSPFCQP